jgi:hypothetical protein
VTVSNDDQSSGPGAPHALAFVSTDGPEVPFRIGGDAKLAGYLASLSATPALDIGGTLDVQGAKLSRLGGLSRIGRDLILSGNGSLSAIDPIGAVGRDVILSNNDALRSFSAVTQAEITGELAVTGNDLLATIEVPQTKIRSVAINGNAVAAQLLAPALTLVERFTVRQNPALPTCQAQAICSRLVGATCTISGNDDAGACP